MVRGAHPYMAELESGGRMIDAILTNTDLPRLSEGFLKRLKEGKPIERVNVNVTEGEFGYGYGFE